MRVCGLPLRSLQAGLGGGVRAGTQEREKSTARLEEGARRRRGGGGGVHRE